MLITFYMTVKNGMPCIKDAVQSIQSQTYPDWEAVIVDDGSSDETPEFLKGLEKRDSRFRIFITGGIGRAKALNFAVAQAKGSVIANLDADDVAHPQRLEIQGQILNKNSYIDFLCAESIIFSTVEDLNFCDETENHNAKNITDSLMIYSNIGHSTVTMRKALFDRVGGYSEQRKMQIDYELWYRIVCSGVKIFKVPHPLGGKRIHENQSFENKKRIGYLISGHLLRMKFLKKINAGIKYKAISLFRLGFGMLPRNLRMAIRTRIL